MYIKEWTSDDVPSPPYFHGTRFAYQVGQPLITDVVNNMEGEEDLRQMCFATICMEEALDWADRRGIVHGGDQLYVYEVHMTDAEVDINMHLPGSAPPITSVMSPLGTVLRLAKRVAVDEYPNATFG